MMNKRQFKAWYRNQNSELSQLWDSVKKPVMIILIITVVVIVVGLIGSADVHNLTLGR